MISSLGNCLSGGSIIPFGFPESICSFILHIPVLPSQGASPPVIAQRQRPRGPARKSRRQPSRKSRLGCQHATRELRCPSQAPDWRRSSGRAGCHIAAPAGLPQRESSAVAGLCLLPRQGTGELGTALRRANPTASPLQGKHPLREGRERTTFLPSYPQLLAVSGDPATILTSPNSQIPAATGEAASPHAPALPRGNGLVLLS